jgi:hypothetical protein
MREKILTNKKYENGQLSWAQCQRDRRFAKERGDLHYANTSGSWDEPRWFTRTRHPSSMDRFSTPGLKPTPVPSAGIISNPVLCSTVLFECYPRIFSVPFLELAYFSRIILLFILLKEKAVRLYLLLSEDT